MFEVEIANEVGLPFNGGFSYEYTSSGQPRIIKIWDENGNSCRVSKVLYRQFREYTRGCLKSWQGMADQAAYEAACDL